MATTKELHLHYEYFERDILTGYRGVRRVYGTAFCEWCDELFEIDHGGDEGTPYLCEDCEQGDD